MRTDPFFINLILIKHYEKKSEKNVEKKDGRKMVKIYAPSNSVYNGKTFYTCTKKTDEKRLRWDSEK